MSQNPYAAPRSLDPAALPTGAAGYGEPQPWEPGEVLAEAWQIFKQHWAVFVGAIILFYGAIFVSQQVIMVALMRPGADRSQLIGTFALALGVQYVVQAYLQTGFLRLCLQAVRGQTPLMGTLFSGASQTLPMLGTLILLGLAILAGTVLLIIPGLILAGGLANAMLFVADTDLGPVAALQASWKSLEGQKGKMLLFFLLGGLVGMAGVFACGVGLLATLPLYFIGWSIVYVRTTGRNAPLLAAEAMPRAV